MTKKTGNFHRAEGDGAMLPDQAADIRTIEIPATVAFIDLRLHTTVDGRVMFDAAPLSVVSQVNKLGADFFATCNPLNPAGD